MSKSRNSTGVQPVTGETLEKLKELGAALGISDTYFNLEKNSKDNTLTALIPQELADILKNDTNLGTVFGSRQNGLKHIDHTALNSLNIPTVLSEYNSKVKETAQMLKQMAEDINNNHSEILPYKEGTDNKAQVTFESNCIYVSSELRDILRKNAEWNAKLLLTQESNKGYKLISINRNLLKSYYGTSKAVKALEEMTGMRWEPGVDIKPDIDNPSVSPVVNIHSTWGKRENNSCGYIGNSGIREFTPVLFCHNNEKQTRSDQQKTAPISDLAMKSLEKNGYKGILKEVLNIYNFSFRYIYIEDRNQIWQLAWSGVDFSRAANLTKLNIKAAAGQLDLGEGVLGEPMDVNITDNILDFATGGAWNQLKKERQKLGQTDKWKKKLEEQEKKLEEQKKDPESKGINLE